MRDVTNPSLQQTAATLQDQRTGSHSQQESQPAEDTVQVKIRQAFEKVQKNLSEEAIKHITKAKVIYKPMDIGISNIRSTGCKPKSWELNYPALAFLLNGGYYAEYASIVGVMGLPVMHHTTWENLVSWLVLMLNSWLNGHVSKLGQTLRSVVKRPSGQPALMGFI